MRARQYLIGSILMALIVPTAGALGAGFAGAHGVEVAPGVDARVTIHATPTSPSVTASGSDVPAVRPVDHEGWMPPMPVPWYDPSEWEESAESEEATEEEAPAPEAAPEEEEAPAEQDDGSLFGDELPLEEAPNPGSLVREVARDVVPKTGLSALLDRVLERVESVWTSLVEPAAPEAEPEVAPEEASTVETESALTTQSARDLTAVDGAALALTAAAAGAAGWALGIHAFLASKLKKIIAVLGFTRLAKDALLDHDARDRLYATVKNNPGITLAGLVDAHGGGRSTVTYHLRVLEREKLVTSRRQGRARLYFVADVGDARHHAPALAVLHHGTTRAVAERVAAAPGLDQQALCASLGLTPSLAHWHVDRLLGAGLLNAVREGRHVRYYPTTTWETVSAIGPKA